MASIQTLLGNCGIGGISPISGSAESIIRDVAGLWSKYNLLEFNSGDNSKYKYEGAPYRNDGQRLAAYIEEHHLGKVVSSGLIPNVIHSAGHVSEAFWWYPDWDAILKHAKKIASAEQAPTPAPTIPKAAKATQFVLVQNQAPKGMK